MAIAVGAWRRVSYPKCPPPSRAIARSCEALSERYRLGVVSNFYGNLEAVCAELGPRSSVRGHGG